MIRRENKVPLGENPVIHANFISRMTFWWLRKIFYRGYRRPVNEEDVFACLKEHESEVIHEQFKVLWTEEKVKKKPSMLKVFFKAFGARTLFWGLAFSFVESLIR